MVPVRGVQLTASHLREFQSSGGGSVSRREIQSRPPTCDKLSTINGLVIADCSASSIAIPHQPDQYVG